MTGEYVSSLSFTIKEINSTTNCSIYTAAAICDPDRLPLVQQVWLNAFTNTDIMYFADDNMKEG